MLHSLYLHGQYRWPQGLVMDSAGNLYGVTFYGGT
jgi:hypothetical protein